MRAGGEAAASQKVKFFTALFCFCFWPGPRMFVKNFTMRAKEEEGFLGSLLHFPLNLELFNSLVNVALECFGGSHIQPLENLKSF